MDRIRQIWIESASSSSYDCSEHHYESRNCNTRPPPLRTSSTYDDDDAFNNVALNLLSRYNTLGLTAKEAIIATLICAKQRASFFDGLCVRIDRNWHLSPNTMSMLQSLDNAFGSELKAMVMSESKEHPCYSTKPVKPRNTSSFFGGSGVSKKKTTSRRFFPDGDKAPCASLFSSNRRVQNIDWKLAEAIKQVEHLRLDGGNTPPQASCYEAPRAF